MFVLYINMYRDDPRTRDSQFIWVSQNYLGYTSQRKLVFILDNVNYVAPMVLFKTFNRIFPSHFMVLIQNFRKVQSAKILLLPPKYEIIMLPYNHSFSNNAIAILDFSLLLLVKLSLLILFASFLVLCFFFDCFLSKLTLSQLLIAIVVALYRS